jgi:hypothetical protein
MQLVMEKLESMERKSREKQALKSKAAVVPA